VSVTNLIFARFIEDGKDLASAAYWWTKGPRRFSFGTVEKAMGLRGIPETELIFKDCSVPAKMWWSKGTATRASRN
jgi:alkylation response protein AidB-like acyl-CoA dehydrogenase